MSENFAVLFDMDGVIFDSERALRAVWLELAAEQGLGDMERVYARCLGVTREVTGSILREEYGEDFPWEAFREETARRYWSRYAGGRLPLKPGAREILRALGERGAPLALASFLTSLVPLNPDETLIDVVSADFTGDGFEDQVNVVRKASLSNLNLIVGVYNAKTESYEYA